MVERLGKTDLQAMMNMALELDPCDRCKQPDSPWCDDFEAFGKEPAVL